MEAKRKAEVVVMRVAENKLERRTVKTEADVAALPAGGPDVRVEGSPGLYVRKGERGASYRVLRKVEGRIVVRVLGEMSLAQARRLAAKAWAELKPKPAQPGMTLGQAWAQYLEEKPLAPKTKRIYAKNLELYLADWKNRTLENLGRDRAGVRARYHEVAKRHGVATAGSVFRTFRAIYRYAARADADLPPAPTVAVDMQAVCPRDWALPPDELRRWWAAVERLNPLKRTFWLTLLLTGARRGSVEALRWRDVDLDRGVIHFTTAKRGRAYAIPACGRLVELLRAWREDCPPDEGDWVFPSPQKPGAHIVAARDDKRGVASAHHLRHTYRTVLAELGATPDQARLLLGHSLGGDVSRGYITPHLLVESLRPIANAVAERFAGVLGW